MSHFRVLNSGGFASLEVTLQRGRCIKAESDAMVTTSANMEVGGHLEGGILSSFFRKITGSSTFFFQTLTSTRDDENSLLAPKLVGDISLLQVAAGGSSYARPAAHAAGGPSSSGYVINRGSFLACDESIQLSTHIQPDIVKGIFGGMDFFFLKASGSGTLAISSVGAIHRYSLAPGEVRYVDNGHIIAFESNLRYEVVQASRNFLSSITSGEGLVCRFIGPGDIWVQTHSAENFNSENSSNSYNGRYRRARGAGAGPNGVLGCCMVLIVFLVFAGMFIYAISQMTNLHEQNFFQNRLDSGFGGFDAGSRENLRPGWRRG